MRSSSSIGLQISGESGRPPAGTPRAGCAPAAGTWRRAGRRSSSRPTRAMRTGSCAAGDPHARRPAGSGSERRPSQLSTRLVPGAEQVDVDARGGRDDDRAREQRVRGVRHEQQRVDVRPHDRAARGERVRGRPGRRRAQDAVAAESQQRTRIDGDRDLEHPLAVGAFERDLVQRPARWPAPRRRR